MNDQNINWNLLVRYINGHCSPDEEMFVDGWMGEDPDHEKFLLFLKKILDNPSETKINWDVDKAWNEFQQENLLPIAREENPPERYRNGSKNGHVAKPSHHSSKRISLVVILCLLVAVSYLVVSTLPNQYRTGLSESESASISNPAYREIVTTSGQRTRIDLDDGSRIILNANSLIRFPEDFGQTSPRNVYLQGEAYFEVMESEGHEFIVSTERSITTVLGTAFRVQEYPDEQRVEIAVSEGTVSVRDQNTPDTQSQILTVNQIAELGSDGIVTIRDIQSPDVYFGWTNGNLVFNETDLTDVMNRLERWYDTKIELDPASPELSAMRITASFTDDQPIQEILEAIALRLEINFIRQDDGSLYSFFNDNPSNQNTN